MNDPKNYLYFTDCPTGKVVGTHNSGSNGNAFKGEQVKNVIIPEFFENQKVTEVGYNSFRETSIKSIFISRYIKEIQWAAFKDCSTLKYVSFDPNSELRTLGTNAFCGTNISSFNFPSSFSKIERDSSGAWPFRNTLTCVSYLGSNDISFNYLFKPEPSSTIAHSSFNYKYTIGTITPIKDNMTCYEKESPFAKRNKGKITRDLSYVNERNHMTLLILLLFIEK